VEQNFPANKKDILFFIEIKNHKNLKFYSCNRYPNQNLIAFDEENKTAYHLVDIYLD
jgi:ssDNA-binding Zn-finger/Zn-ribbon topoisomerase 1